MDFGPNAVFIVTTYAATFVILAGLVAWLALDRRYLVRVIEQMEAQGAGRRSEHKLEENSWQPPMSRP
jgi:heme exporter protein CcmD